MSCLNCGQYVRENARFCECCGALQKQAKPAARDLPLISSGRVLGNPYVRGLTRFWWLLVIGVAVAVVAALLSVYRIDFGSVPPSLEKRDEVVYTSSARLLVTSTEAPYFRTTVPRETELGGGGDPSSSTTFRAAPDIGTLIATANLYPILIESDDVRQIRQEMFGVLPGTVTARAIYEVNSPSRFELSQVPVVEVFANSDSYDGAVRLTQGTIDAFLAYIDRTQNTADLTRNERILLQPIALPAGATSSGGTSLALPLMVFVVIVAAFAALAILLDRLFPSGLIPARWRAMPVRADGPLQTDGDGTGKPSTEGELQTERSRARA